MMVTSLGRNHCISSGPLAGMMAPKPIPNAKRNTSREPKLGAKADKDERPIKSQPRKYMRLRPNRTARIPPGKPKKE